jgi:hypothetical protein
MLGVWQVTGSSPNRKTSNSDWCLSWHFPDKTEIRIRDMCYKGNCVNTDSGIHSTCLVVWNDSYKVLRHCNNIIKGPLELSMQCEPVSNVISMPEANTMVVCLSFISQFVIHKYNHFTCNQCSHTAGLNKFVSFQELTSVIFWKKAMGPKTVVDIHRYS